MIVMQPQCRKQLTIADFDYILHSLGVTQDADAVRRDIVTDASMLDEFLDDERLHQSIIEHPEQLNISFSLYSYVLVRRVLLQHSLPSRVLADYIATIVFAFVTKGTMQAFITGKEPMFYATDYMEKISETTGLEQFNLRVQLANRALFVTGIFPDHLNYRVQRTAAPNISYYETIGSSQYQMVSGHRLAHENGLNEVFETLGNDFLSIRQALNIFRDRFMLFRNLNITNGIID